MSHDLRQFADRYDLDLAFFDKVMGGLPPVTTDGPWLAGGAIRHVLLGEVPDSDWDFFFKSADQAEEFHQALVQRGFAKTNSNQHARTYFGTIDGKRIKVQAITIAYYATLADCLDTFDFTICQLGWDGVALHTGEYTLWDLGRKRLSVHKVTFATATVRRLLKYTKQGLTACNGTFRAVLEAVAKDPTVIHSETQYVD